MTAPALVDPAELTAVRDQLFKWLKQHGYTQAASGKAWFESREFSSSEPRGSLAYIISRALFSVSSAHINVKRSATTEALTQAALVRARVVSLQRALRGLDADRARRGFPTARPSFAESGDAVLEAIDAVVQRFQSIQGTTVPVTRAQWKRYIAKITASLQKAGMPLEEIARLLAPSSDPAVFKERARKQRERGTVQGAGAEKKKR